MAYRMHWTRRELMQTAAGGVALAGSRAAPAGATDATKPITNDTQRLAPQTTFPGRELRFDLPALQVGVAEYAEGPTGCTVFSFPRGASAAVDIRGGSVGFVGDYGYLHAICLAGGSLYGLEAASGVAAELFARSGYSTQFGRIALVSGGIIYDFGRRRTAVYPDGALGRAALKAARPGVFPLGARGAGRSAGVGAGLNFDKGEASGQGGAYRRVGPTQIAVFTVVNALGAIFDRSGRPVRGYVDPKTGKRGSPVEDLEQQLKAGDAPQPKGGNTTLTVLVTNQKVATSQLTQLARQVHSSMARAIQPFHTQDDGDILWAVTTNEVENPTLRTTALGVLASELAWDAVLASAPQA